MVTIALFWDWLSISQQIKPLRELMASKKTTTPICFRQFAKQEEE